MQLPFFPQDSTFSYEIAPLCFLAIVFRESPWCGYITDCRRAASEKHRARRESTVSVWTKTFLSKGKRHFFILGKKTHILLVVSFFFFLYSFHVLALSIQEKKKKRPKTYVTAGWSSLFWWAELDWLDLNSEQLYKGIRIDCYTKYLLIPRFLTLIYMSYWRGASQAPMTLLLYHALCTIHKNTRASGMPEVSCGQSHGMTARPLRETITVFHEDSSRPRAFYKTAAHSDIYPLQGFC